MGFSDNSKRSIGSRLEKAVASFLGWDVVTGSGSRDFHPGDLVSENWMGECKTHTSPSSSIVFYRSHWDKICEEAYSHFKYPVLFCDNGTQKAENTWCVCKRISVTCEEQTDCPIKIRKNLSILLEDMDRTKVYRFKFGQDECVLCSLSTFSEIGESLG